METYIRRSEITWQTKVLASTIANTVPDKKAQETLLKQISQHDLNGDENAQAIEAPADTSGDGSLDQDAVVRQALERNSRRRGPGLPFR